MSTRKQNAPPHKPFSLESIRKGPDAGFSVPEGYFDSLPRLINDQIHQKKAGTRWYSHLLQKKIFWISAVAASALIISLAIRNPFLQNSGVPQNNTADSTNLQAAYDASYANDAIHSDYVEINKIIESAAADSVILSSYSKPKLDDVSDEDIATYLNEQDLDIDLLSEL